MIDPCRVAESSVTASVAPADAEECRRSSGEPIRVSPFHMIIPCRDWDGEGPLDGPAEKGQHGGMRIWSAVFQGIRGMTIPGT